MRLALVHGFTQTGRSWLPLVPLLEAAGHEVVCPDAPGHGATPAMGLDAGAAHMADTVGRAVWIGYSMGGRLCLHLALDHPEMVDALVLVSTTAGIDDVAEREERRRADHALADRIEVIGVEAFIDEWLDGPLWKTLPRERAGVADRLTNTVSGLAASLRLMGTGEQAPLWDRLADIRLPTCVITGEADAKFTSLGDRMAAAVGAGAIRRRIRGAGHAVPWEQPERFVAAITDALTVPPGPGQG